MCLAIINPRKSGGRYARHMTQLMTRWISLACLALLPLIPLRAHATTLTIGTSTGTGMGTGTTAQFPVYTTFGYSYSQSIYPAGQLVAAGATAGVPGIINSISYYVSNYCGFPNSKDWVVYVGNTTTASYMSTTAWVPVTGMTKVFDGTVMPTGTGWYTITFTTPFLWDGSSNLVVAVDENTPGHDCGSNYYRCTLGASLPASIIAISDTYNPDPAAPPSGTVASYLSLSGTPDIQLDYNMAPACGSTLVGGTAIASAASVCSGKPVSLSVSGATLAVGISYVWDTSASAAGPWGALTTALPTANYTFVPPSGRTLYYHCRVLCNPSGAVATSSSVTVTAAPFLVPPYTEDFESATAGVNVPCAATTGTWAASSVCYGQYFDLKTTSPCSSGYPSIANHTPGGNNYLWAGYSLGSYSLGTSAPAAEQQYWYTPGIQLYAGNTYRFSYWYVNSGYNSTSAKVGMYYNTAQSQTGAVAIGADITDNNTNYKQNFGDFSVPADGVYYMAVKINQTAYNYYGTAFDDVSLIQLPGCSATTTLGAGGHVIASQTTICSIPGSATFSLTGTPPYSNLNFSWECATGTPVSFTATGLATLTATYNFTANGIYYMRCKISCPASGAFTYSDTIRIATVPLTPPYSEDFENTPAGVNVPCAAVAGTFAAGSTMYWDTKALNPYSVMNPGIRNHTPGGSKYLFAGSSMGTYNNAAPGFWITPGLALKAGKAYAFSFWYSSNQTNAPTYNYGPLQLGVRVGTAQNLAAMSYPAGADTVVLPSAAAVPTYDQLSRGFMVPATGTYYVGIKNNPLNNNSPGIALDDIALVELPSCASKPSAGNAVASAQTICGGASDTLYLTGTAWASDLTFQWQRSATGLAGSWSDVSTGTGANASVYITPSLTATGPVYYRCIVKCPAAPGVNADTSAAALVNVNAITPPYSENFEQARPGVNMPCAGYTGTWTAGSSNYWDMRIAAFAQNAYPGIANHTPGGSCYLYAGAYLGIWSNAAQYWFTPALALTASKAYKCSFWFSNTAYTTYASYTTFPLELGVRAGSAQTAPAMTISAGADTIVYPNSSGVPGYNQLQRGFIASATGNYYMRFRRL